ncbi:MAG: nuclear transport factor 2 family protein [Burkholderiales bacterium]
MSADHDLEANKALVRAFLEAFAQGGFAAALNHVSDDCRWWTAGATYSMAQIAGLGQWMEAHLTDGIRMEVGTLTAECDRVAAEAQSHAPLTNGQVYVNQYHYLCRVAGGRIVEVREHCDTHHAKTVFATLAG